jgi:hypothetical protein
MPPSHALTAILPCNDLDASAAFYNRLGFARPDSERPAKGEDDSYRMLSDGKGGHLHLTDAVEGWLIPGRNPFALYLMPTMSTHWRRNSKASRSKRTDRSTSLGACMNSRSPIPTRRWSASDGGRGRIRA